MNQTEAPRATRGQILAMAFTAGAVVANIYFAQPMLPLIAADLHAPADSIGLIPACNLAGFAAGLATLVPLGDAFDRKRIVLMQIAAAALFATLAALAPNLPVLLAASLGLGFVSCAPQQMVPFAATMAAPFERGRAVGTVASGIMLGLLMGRVVGGALSAVMGWRLVFGFAAAFMLVAFALTARLLPAGKPTTDLSYGRLLASLWPLLRDHAPLRNAIASQTLLWICFNAFWASLASLLAHSWGLGPFWAGAFGLVGVAGALAANAGGRAADRVGPLKVLAFSVVCVALGYVALAFGRVSLAALVVGVVLLDLGCQSALVSNQTRIFALDPKAQGRLNTVFMMSIFLGGAAGAALSGALMARFGWNGVVAEGLVAAGLAGLAHSRAVQPSAISARS
jgi:predicted MFS family arabinose efflux permease